MVADSITLAGYVGVAVIRPCDLPPPVTGGIDEIYAVIVIIVQAILSVTRDVVVVDGHIAIHRPTKLNAIVSIVQNIVIGNTKAAGSIHLLYGDSGLVALRIIIDDIASN